MTLYFLGFEPIKAAPKCTPICPRVVKWVLFGAKKSHTIGQVTEEQMRFFLSTATHDMIEEELSQLKHKVPQDTPTIPISEDRDNLIFSQTREEDDGPEFSPSSFNPSSVDDVVSDLPFDRS